jgi:3-hydroxyisobutyrate dehydrogenase
MAGHILAKGHPMVVHDVRAEVAARFRDRGARLAASPAELARASDVVFTSLPGPPEVEAVALGAGGVLEGIRAGSAYVDLSTSRPALIRRIAPLFEARGAHALDAPVSGGKTGAESRNLAVMVGGPREVYERVRPILSAFGEKVFHAGGVGAGSVAKLVHNMISHGIRQAIAEGLTLGVKAGVDPVELWECVRRGAVGRMHVLHEGLPRTMFRGQFDPPGFSLALARKDIGLAMELGREYDVPMPVASLAEQIAIEAMNRGWADLDHTVTVRLQEEAAGTEVRATGVDLARAAAFITTHPAA